MSGYSNDKLGRWGLLLLASYSSVQTHHPQVLSFCGVSEFRQLIWPACCVLDRYPSAHTGPAATGLLAGRVAPASHNTALQSGVIMPDCLYSQAVVEDNSAAGSAGRLQAGLVHNLHIYPWHAPLMSRHQQAAVLASSANKSVCERIYRHKVYCLLSQPDPATSYSQAELDDKV